MQIKDVMTHEVASLDIKDTVEHAAQMMNEFNIGSLPVCENEKVIGMVTDRDITLRSVAQGQNTKTQTVREIMSSNPVTINPTTDVNDAVRIMSERQVRRLPVVENNKVIGMVALGDIAVEPQLCDNAEDALKNISEPATPNL